MSRSPYGTRAIGAGSWITSGSSSSMTDELRRSFGAGELAEHALGKHFFGLEALEASRTWRFGPNTDDHQRTLFSACGTLVLADADGDREAVRAAIDPVFHDLVDALEPAEQTSLGAVIRATKGNGSSDGHLLVTRITDAAGQLMGSAIITKPPIGMSDRVRDARRARRRPPRADARRGSTGSAAHGDLVRRPRRVVTARTPPRRPARTSPSDDASCEPPIGA